MLFVITNFIKLKNVSLNFLPINLLNFDSLILYILTRIIIFNHFNLWFRLWVLIIKTFFKDCFLKFCDFIYQIFLLTFNYFQYLIYVNLLSQKRYF